MKDINNKLKNMPSETENQQISFADSNSEGSKSGDFNSKGLRPEELVLESLLRKYETDTNLLIETIERQLNAQELSEDERSEKEEDLIKAKTMLESF
jgi:hypothetical protein